MNTTNVEQKTSPDTQLSNSELRSIFSASIKLKLSDNLSTEINAVNEAFIALNDDRVIMDDDPFLECKSMLVHILCLLANPEISSQISESFYKKNAGNILRRMINFFDILENHCSPVSDYLTYYNIKHLGGGMTKDDFAKLSNYINNDLN